MIAKSPRSSLSYLAAAFGALSFAFAALALVGAALDLGIVVHLPPALIGMKTDTSVSSIFMGLALLIAGLNTNRLPPLDLLRRVFALVVLLVGGAGLLHYFFDLPTGLEALILHPGIAGAQPLVPGTMAPTTALVFICLGAAQLLSPGRTRVRALVQALELFGLTLTLLSSLTILYDLKPATGFGSTVHTMPRTALTLLVLSLGSLFLDPDYGLLGLLRSGSSAGALTRRLVPAAVGVPILVGAFQIAGTRRGLYEATYGLLFSVLFDMVLLSLVAVWGARSIGGLREKREQGDQEVRESARRLLALTERFGLAIKAANLGIWDWNVEDDRLVWDDRMFELYDIEQGEFPGVVEGWTARLHPADLNRSLDDMSRAISGQSEYDTEFRIVLRDGSVRHLRAFGQITRDAAGKALRMTGINYDITDLKLAEQEIKAKNELLILTGQLAKVGGWEFDAASGAGSWTDEVARIHDLDPSTGTSVEFGLGFYTEDSRPRIEAAVKAAVDSAEPFDLELQILSAKGQRKWVRTVGMPVVDEGRVVRVRGIFQDITERKKNEAVLHENERILQLFVENSPAAIAMFDLDMRYLIVSKSWVESYHLEGVPVIGRSHYEVFPEIGEDWKAVHRRCLAGAVESRENDPFPRADGSLDWVRWVVRPWYTAEGTIGGIIILAEVVTDRRKAELAIRASEERYRNLFDNMVEGFALCKMIFEEERPVDWIYLAVNPAFEQLTGLAAVTGRWVSEVIPGILETDPELFELYGRVASSGKPERLETEVKSLNMWFSLSVYSPEPDHFVAVFDVITERKLAEAEVRRLNAELEDRVRQRTAELEAANAELEAFSYSVSHDLRAPLRGIDGWSLALQEEYGATLDETARGYLDRVRSESGRMSSLIDDMLQLSRVTRATLRTEELDLSSLARGVAERARAAYVGRDIEIEVASDLRARGDKNLLEIALFNLMDNAMKFSAPRAKARIEFGRREEEGVSVFYLRDNGVGFDMRYSDKLFAPFQRLHRISEFPGTGIGLATVRRIVTRLGGRIWVESQKELGTSFYFTLGVA